jgi:NAD-dependent DNA ligase
MNLFDFIEDEKPAVEQPPVQTLKEKVRQRRAQMLIHSCIYYELNETVVDDHTWQRWADELEQLQKQNPELLVIDFFDHEFKDWDGATGAHLPHRHPWVYNKALQILNHK